MKPELDILCSIKAKTRNSHPSITLDQLMKEAKPFKDGKLGRK